MTRLEAAEMRFLRIVTGYTRLDKIRGEVIRKELEISGIQDVRLKYKQNWINHLEITDNTRPPETRPQLQTSRKKRSWTHKETMAMRRCRNRSNDLIHGGWWWWWWTKLNAGELKNSRNQSSIRVRAEFVTEVLWGFNERKFCGVTFNPD